MFVWQLIASPLDRSIHRQEKTVEKNKVCWVSESDNTVQETRQFEKIQMLSIHCEASLLSAILSLHLNGTLAKRRDRSSECAPGVSQSIRNAIKRQLCVRHNQWTSLYCWLNRDLPLQDKAIIRFARRHSKMCVRPVHSYSQRRRYIYLPLTSNWPYIVFSTMNCLGLGKGSRKESNVRCTASADA